MLWTGVKSMTGIEKNCEESIWLLCRVLFFCQDTKKSLTFRFWVICGFGVLAMAAASLLWKDFQEFLPAQNQTKQPEEELRANRKSDREILKEMKKLREFLS